MKAQRSVFALDTMDEVTLVKTADFKEVTTAKEALDRLGNDSAKFLEVINTGLEDMARKSLVGDSNIPWMQEAEDGTLSPFSGTVADQKQVNNLILTLAKTVFGYSKDKTIEERRAAKDDALEMIKSSDKMKEGLQKNAAA